MKTCATCKRTQPFAFFPHNPRGRRGLDHVLEMHICIP